MNKLFTKIAAACVTAAMAVGVGVAISAGYKDAEKVNAATQTLTFNVSSNPGGWPTTNSTTLTNYTYSLNDVDYTFALKNVKCNSGYLMLTQPAALGLPSITGYRLSKVVAANSSGCSTTTKVGISSSGTSESYVSGGAIQTWGTVSSSYTYNLSDTAASTMYYMYVTNKNCQLVSLELTYEQSTVTSVAITSSSYLKDGGSMNISGTITNDNSYTIDWTSSDSTHVSFTPTSSVSGGNVSVEFNGVTTGTTPIVITATLHGTSISATKNVYALEHAGTAADPFSATDAHVFSHSNYAAQSGGDWYVEGYVVREYVNNSLTKGYYIDEDKTATSSTKFEVFNNSGITNNTGISVIVGTSKIVAHGAMTCYNNSQCESTGSIITSVDNGSLPSVNINEGNTTVNLSDTGVSFTATTDNAGGNSVVWSSSDASVASINSSSGAVTINAIGSTTIRATLTVSGTDYISEITLTVVTEAVEIGDLITISAVYSGTSYYLSGVNTTTNLGTCTTASSSAMIFEVEAGNESGSFALKNGDDYLKAADSNNLYTETSVTNNSSWLVLTDGTHFTIKNVAFPARTLQYNDNGHVSDSSKTNRFAAYTTAQTEIVITQVEKPEVDYVTVMGDATADAHNDYSIEVEFLYEVTYVDSGNPGPSTITVSVVDSHDDSSHASVTGNPDGTSFKVTFSKDETYTVTITSVEDPTKTDSTEIVVSNIHAAIQFAQYSGTTVSGNALLTEGDYVIYYSTYALKAAITSDRAENVEVTPESNIISTGDASIIWHIAPHGDYFTIYNASVNKYLASTGVKNKAQLLASGTDDKSLWSVTISSGSFEFVNKYNSANSVNSNLRNNGTNGWACYATTTGGALSLYKQAYSADDYAKLFLENIGCDSTGTTAPLAANWNLLAALYSETTSDAKTTLINDDGVEYQSPATEAQRISEAMYLYDYVIAKYNKQSEVYAPFITGRTGSGLVVGANMLFNVDSQTTTAIIVVIAVASISAIGAIFFIRRRKYN